MSKWTEVKSGRRNKKCKKGKSLENKDVILSIGAFGIKYSLEIWNSGKCNLSKCKKTLEKLLQYRGTEYSNFYVQYSFTSIDLEDFYFEYLEKNRKPVPNIRVLNKEEEILLNAFCKGEAVFKDIPVEEYYTGIIRVVFKNLTEEELHAISSLQKDSETLNLLSAVIMHELRRVTDGPLYTGTDIGKNLQYKICEYVCI